MLSNYVTHVNDHVWIADLLYSIDHVINVMMGVKKNFLTDKSPNKRQNLQMKC